MKFPSTSSTRTNTSRTTFAWGWHGANETALHTTRARIQKLYASMTGIWGRHDHGELTREEGRKEDVRLFMLSGTTSIVGGALWWNQYYSVHQETKDQSYWHTECNNRLKMRWDLNYERTILRKERWKVWAHAKPGKGKGHVLIAKWDINMGSTPTVNRSFG